MLEGLIEHERKKDAKVIFVLPQFSTKSSELVAREIGGHVALVDTLAEDWIANLYEVAEKFKKYLRKERYYEHPHCRNTGC